MNAKRPRRLDLNAPLLSTRRSIATTLELSRTNSLYGSCDRVPFSWEQSPGKPKDIVRRESFSYEGLPLPKPPPIRWQEETYTTDDHECEDKHDTDYDDNSNNNNYNNDAFLDVIDLFSLAPSLNPSERLDMESAQEEDTDLESDTATTVGNNGLTASPNFMIQRFLPAATALATSSLSSLGAKGGDLSTTNKHFMSRYLNKSSEVTSLERSCVPRVVGQKGCGLQLLFPWRAKRKISRLKNPVQRVHPNLKLQLGPKNN